MVLPAGPPPQPDAESAEWWSGLRAHRLLLQRCSACSRLRFPPIPACPWCACTSHSAVDAVGRGTVYSAVTAFSPVSPDYDRQLPYSVATVELDEGPRVFGRVEPAVPVEIGDRVEARFADHEEWTELYFAPIPWSNAPTTEGLEHVEREMSRARGSATSSNWTPVATGRQAAVVGVGYTAFSKASGRSVLALASEAVAAALDDAGLAVGDVDAMASFMVSDDSVPCVAVASVLGMGPLRSTIDLNLGGQAPCHLVWLAAQAVARGDANVVVVYRALNGRSGHRVGAMRFAGMGGQFRYPLGYGAYLMYVGMWARRFLHETGQGAEDLAAVAMSQRWYAQRNERALRRESLELDAYLAEPYVVEPFRRSDCTVEVDGGCAVVVTSLDRARDLRHPPAVVSSGCYRAGPRPGLDIGDHLMWEDYTRNYTGWLREELFGRAGIGPGDAQVAEIYDCFTSTVLMGLEGLGLCGRGEAGGFVRSGGCRLDGSLPTNTGGGLLSEGYLHGMNTVAEAVLQVQGRCGDRQASKHEVAVVTSGALMDGSALILAADR